MIPRHVCVRCLSYDLILLQFAWPLISFTLFTVFPLLVLLLDSLFVYLFDYLLRSKYSPCCVSAHAPYLCVCVRMALVIWFFNVKFLDLKRSKEEQEKEEAPTSTIHLEVICFLLIFYITLHVCNIQTNHKHTSIQLAWVGNQSHSHHHHHHKLSANELWTYFHLSLSSRKFGAYLVDRWLVVDCPFSRQIICKWDSSMSRFMINLR